MAFKVIDKINSKVIFNYTEKGKFFISISSQTTM